MKKWLVVCAALFTVGTVVGIAVNNLSDSQVPPTTAVSSLTSTLTAAPSRTITPTTTLSSTSTYTYTATSTPTLTPTLATRVLYITAINSDVPVNTPLPASVTPVPPITSTAVIPPPPADFPTAPDRGTIAPGWVRYEADDPRLNSAAGRWFPFKAARATHHGYTYSADRQAHVTLNFTGAGARIRYVTYSLFGIFEVYLDGRVVATINGYSARPAFLSTDIFGLVQGAHTLEIANTGRKDPSSAGYLLGLDSIDVYQTLPAASLAATTPGPTATFTPSPARAESIRQIAGPPTLLPTITARPPVLVAASLVIAYDENGNHAADPAEGVRDISVRLVTLGTNQVVASGFTNAEGYLRLETLANAPVRLVVPYFSKFWDVPASRGTEPRFSLILPPVNQPGLIP